MNKFKKILLTFALVATICLSSLVLFACNEKTNTIEIAKSFKTTYFVGEDLDVTGGTIKYYDKDGKVTTVDIQENMVSMFDNEKPGKRKLKITYEDKTLMVNYTIKPWDVQDGYYANKSKTEASDQDLLTFLLFDTAQSKVSLFNAYKTDNLTEETQKLTCQMTKSYDDNGFIIYTFRVPVYEGPNVTYATYTISEITKDSLKMSAVGQDLTLKVYNPN